jgi:anti-anti-sigma regulatory factor
MVICNGDNSGEVLTISYSQRVKASEVKRCVATARDRMGHLKPGFLLLVDLTSLESMDEACASEVGALMDACNAKGLSSVIWVIPDPKKDIGFNLLSHFHYHSQVKRRTCASLAEAIKMLLSEKSPSEESSEILSHDEMNRKMDDDLAEAHFTVVARKEAEVNEGGIVEASRRSPGEATKPAYLLFLCTILYFALKT